MILQRRLAPLVILVLLRAAAPSNPEVSFFVGHWYGMGEPSDPSVSYIDSYRADGTYVAAFRKCMGAEEIWRQTASGTWTLKDGVLRMIADTVDGRPDHFDNSYTVEYAAGDEFRARLHEPDFLFIEKRIPTFEFPPCYIGM